MADTGNSSLSCTLVFDFDSTLIADETLDILAAIVGESRSDKDALAAEIARITDLGMNGEIDLRESFARRFALLQPTRVHIQQLATKLLEKIAPSVSRSKDFFMAHAEHIYVITGSFRESVLPTTRLLGLVDSHVFGNVLLYNEHGVVVGVDPTIPTSHSGGKADIIQAIRTTTPNLLLPIVMVGDGMSDANAKKPGVAADLFWAYTEVISRPTVVPKADNVAQSMDDVFNFATMI